MRRACVRAACVRGVRAAWGTHVAVHDAVDVKVFKAKHEVSRCLLYTSPSPRDS